MKTNMTMRPTIALTALALACGPAWADVTCVFTGPSYGNNSDGTESVVCGILNNMDFDDEGDYIPAGDQSAAYGSWNQSTGKRSNAFGYSNLASGEGSNAFGGGYFLDIYGTRRRNEAAGLYSNAFGAGNRAPGDFSNAFGVANTAGGYGSSAFGYFNEVSYGGNAFGYQNKALGGVSNAYGYSNVAYGTASNAFGVDNRVLGNAFGRANQVSGINSSALGSFDIVGGDYSTAIGSRVEIGALEYDANGNLVINASGYPSVLDAADHAIAIGASDFDDDPTRIAGGADSAIAIGRHVTVSAEGVDAIAIGRDSQASAAGAVALGAESIADRAASVSFGNTDLQRQLVNVAAASEDTDAVNLSQLSAAATAFGGGVSYAGGTFAAPTYVIQGLAYNDVGAAFGAVDGRISDLYSIVASGDGSGPAGPEGPAGPAGPKGDPGDTGLQGPEGPAGGGPRMVAYDQDAGDTLTLKGANGTTISNVANGIAATDAVNKGQMDAGDAATLQSANDYTDTTATQTLASANAYTDAKFAAWNDQFEAVDDRFRQQDRRIDRMSAMSGAYAGMAMNTAGLAGSNRVGVGVGGQGGESALAVGYQRVIGNRASVSIGGAISGGEKSVMGGAGFSW
jgi:trimeric autotransporter adhesin